MLGEARSLLAVHRGLLDQYPWLLACPNTTIDLRSGECLRPDPAHLLSHVTPVDYDPTA